MLGSVSANPPQTFSGGNGAKRTKQSVWKCSEAARAGVNSLCRYFRRQNGIAKTVRHADLTQELELAIRYFRQD
jgi:hypothetical protein